MNTVDKKSPNYEAIKYQDIIECKHVSIETLKKDYSNIKKNINPHSFAGNKIIYHYQFKELLSTNRSKSITLESIFQNEDKKKYWINQTIKMDRRKKLDYIAPVDIFECYRRCKGSVNTFKSCSMKHIIEKFNGTSVLDPTAGWGGRLLGTASLGLPYTGIDTNINLKEGYDQMVQDLDITNTNMIFSNCLNVDFSQIDYDIVITSPPYFNLEEYNHMTPFESNEKYYTEFLIPLIKKCKMDINNNGKVCINISDYMYNDYLKFGGSPCLEFFTLKQQMGGKKNKEFVYVF